VLPVPMPMQVQVQVRARVSVAQRVLWWLELELPLVLPGAPLHPAC
jgi:hypothetical protein